MTFNDYFFLAAAAAVAAPSARDIHAPNCALPKIAKKKREYPIYIFFTDDPYGWDCRTTAARPPQTQAIN